MRKKWIEREEDEREMEGERDVRRMRRDQSQSERGERERHTYTKNRHSSLNTNLLFDATGKNVCEILSREEGEGEERRGREGGRYIVNFERRIRGHLLQPKLRIRRKPILMSENELVHDFQARGEEEEGGEVMRGGGGREGKNGGEKGKREEKTEGGEGEKGEGRSLMKHVRRESDSLKVEKPALQIHH